MISHWVDVVGSDYKGMWQPWCHSSNNIVEYWNEWGASWLYQWYVDAISPLCPFGDGCVDKRDYELYHDASTMAPMWEIH